MTEIIVAIVLVWAIPAILCASVGFAGIASEGAANDPKGVALFVLGPIWPIAIVAFWLYHAYQLAKPLLPKRTEKRVKREENGPYR